MSDTRFDQDLRTVLRDMAPADAPDTLRSAVAEIPRTAPAAGRRLGATRSLFAIAGLAAAVVVGVIGIVALVGGRPSGIVGTGGTPSPITTPPATATPVAGTSIEYQVLNTRGIAPTASDLTTIRTILGERLGALAVVPYSIAVTGTDLLTVTVPGAQADDLRRLIGATGHVDFVPLGQTPMDVGQAVDMTTFPPLFSGDQVAAATIGANQTGQRTVDFTLTSKGKDLFAAYTAAHVGDYFAVVLDGSIITAPVIQASIPNGQVEISQNGIGGYPLADAQTLVAIFTFGQLPFPLAEVAVTDGSSGSPAPTGAQQPPLSISNGTSIPVTLLVNGTVVETVAPGDIRDPITAPLPARPWTIETRSPSGRVLSTLTVAANDPIGSTFGRAVRVDLSCGRLDVWSGPPLLGPAFSLDPSSGCG